MKSSLAYHLTTSCSIGAPLAKFAPRLSAVVTRWPATVGLSRAWVETLSARERRSGLASMGVI